MAASVKMVCSGMPMASVSSKINVNLHAKLKEQLKEQKKSGQIQRTTVQNVNALAVK